MKVLVFAEDATERQQIRDVVLEALQGEGKCNMTPHKEADEICRRLQPDLVVVCNYSEEGEGNGFATYQALKSIMSEEDMIRVGSAQLKHQNYCRSDMSLRAAVHIQHRWKKKGATAVVR